MTLQGKEENGFIVLKLDDGEDFMGAMKNAIGKFHITSGIIQSGIGMLRDIEIGYFDGKNYLTEHLAEPHELVSMQGSISTKGEIIIHVHCALAGKKHSIVGGHLMKAEVCVVNEILIKKFQEIELGRVLNPKTGLKELTVD